MHTCQEYLFAIYLLSKKYDFVRISTLAKFLSLTEPSVTLQIKQLTKQRLVLHRRYSTIRLTESGQQMAENFSNRYNVWEDFCEFALDSDSFNYQDIIELCELSSPRVLTTLEKYVSKISRKEDQTYESTIE